MSMFRKWSKSSKSQAEPAPRFEAVLAPAQPFWAIGDVHGCHAQMRSILNYIDSADSVAPVIFVGDYVDRGEDSKNVLSDILELQKTADREVICLKGNHEEMVLRFLDDPGKTGPGWLRYGGLQTLASFSVRANASDPDQLAQTRDALVEAMGDEMITWLREMPSCWVSGNVAVTHAGANPNSPMSEQTTKSLHWGHPDFERIPRQDGMWVVHGHTIVDQPKIEAGRISIDTGAYATGHLTTAYVSAAGINFSTT